MRLAHEKKENFMAWLPSSLPKAAKDNNLRIFKGLLDRKEEIIAHGLQSYKNLYFLENALEGKRYLVDNRLTAADTSVYPRILSYPTAGLPITTEHFPNICRYMKRLANEPFIGKSRSFQDKVLRFLFEKLQRLTVLLANWTSGENSVPLCGLKYIDRAKAEALALGQGHLQKCSEDIGPDDVILYDYTASAECWQAKLLLLEKGQKFQTVSCDNLDLIGRPYGSGQIYRIQHGRRLVWGPRAMLEYIDEAIGDKAYIPHDPYKRAQVQCWKAWEQAMHATEIAPAFEVQVLSKIVSKRYKQDIDDLLSLKNNLKYSDKFTGILKVHIAGLSPTDVDYRRLQEQFPHLFIGTGTAGMVAATLKTLQGRLQHIEETLSSHPFLVGDEVTYADICVFCRLAFVQLLGLDISEKNFPKIASWISKLKENPNFQSVFDGIVQEFL
ncbi:hypothetical protein ScPMuIL_011289 [Solemya velum]